MLEYLIGLYLWVCDYYQSSLRHCCERYSNNQKACLTDEEIITIFSTVSNKDSVLSSTFITTLLIIY